MRAGATSRDGTAVGLITSRIDTALSRNTSYIFFSMAWRSTYDMLLLACGSRSMRSVFLCRKARAAARLMAVVVLPTPPFWFAIARIIRRVGRRGLYVGG